MRAIDTLTGEGGLYPSRSELIRVAVRDFLIRELEAAKSFANFQQQQNNQFNNLNSTKKFEESVIDENLFVKVPVTENPEGIVEYKTYKLVQKNQF